MGTSLLSMASSARLANSVIFAREVRLYGYHNTNTFRHVVLIPEEPEDMWHAYNLVTKGDSVKSTTIR